MSQHNLPESESLDGCGCLLVVVFCFFLYLLWIGLKAVGFVTLGWFTVLAMPAILAILLATVAFATLLAVCVLLVVFGK